LRRWRLRPRDPQAEAKLEKELGVSELLAQLLVQRGISDPQGASAFLEPSLSRDLRSPMLFREMAPAVDRLVRALRENEPLVVYGDYDVDGLAGTAALTLYLREIGGRVEAFVPHRLRDGYGLRLERLREMAAAGARAIVTVDCGAVAHDELAAARELGLDAIVCDHHHAPSRRPPAFAVLNPVAEDAGFPFKGLSGVGVAFYLMMGTRMRLREAGGPVPDLRKYLDLVALGTVADLVPLREENRVFVRHGLRILSRRDRPGLRALLEVAGGEGEVSADTVGFDLGPRINASGRLADPKTALELLMTSDRDAGRLLAEELDEWNRRRRAEELRIVEEAAAKIAATPTAPERRTFVLSSEGWHPGVLGVAASRLVERFHRVVVLLAEDGDWCVGSGRAIPGVHLAEALNSCRDLLDRFGGHAMAAGLRLRRGNVGEFRARFERAVGASLGAEALEPLQLVDAELDLDRISPDLLEDLQRLEPFGPGNPSPVFMARGVEVRDVRVFGERHLRMWLRGCGGGRMHEAVGFGMTGRKPQAGSRLDVLFTPEVDRFWRSGRIRLRMVDFVENP
jgi:single-stranded-DNA-specific exonuclease